MIRLAKLEDIKDLAIIYKDLYDNADIGENWTIESATDLLTYWYNKQGDLFFVDIEDGKPVGAVVSGIKSWFDGNRLVDGEIFVAKEYQRNNIATKLMLEHLKQAKIKYNAKIMEFHTYGDETEFPQNWYSRIGYKKDEELIIMNGDIEDVLGHLGYVSNGSINTNEELVKNYSYSDLSGLYSNLKTGDKAYIFDMLPSIAYKDNELEKAYIESRITAMKNGADVTLFIVGSKERLDSFKDNELFKYTLDSCYNNGKIYIIESNEIKDNSPLEFFQLANGLYFGEYSDGSKEVFRDLWKNENSIGLLIKDPQIVNYMEESIGTIITKIENNEIKPVNEIVSK